MILKKEEDGNDKTGRAKMDELKNYREADPMLAAVVVFIRSALKDIGPTGPGAAQLRAALGYYETYLNCIETPEDTGEGEGDEE
jgi:hypothetical protein